MKINVIGLGYIGLPTAAMFAHNGASVLGIDINQKIVDTINQGKIHIEEPGLAELVAQVTGVGSLTASTIAKEADVHIISVPTPNNNDSLLSCDLTYVDSAVQSIIPLIKKGDVIIIESTIAPRVTDDSIAPLIEKTGFVIGEDIFLAHCPERVLPGKILDELVQNNRIVGGVTPQCAEKAAKIYSLFVKGEILITEAKTAEMSKLMENTFRDVNIALANELAKICNQLEINVLDVISMANKHPRVNIHSPGPGVGGHCLAVDPYFIYSKAPETAKIIKLARDTNASMPAYVVENVEKLIGHDKSKTIACLGVTYKPNVDDIRESPALKIINSLKELGYNVIVHDPHVTNPEYVTFDDVLTQADFVLCLVGHDEFKASDFSTLSEKTLIFDVSNSLNLVHVVNYGNLHERLAERKPNRP